MGDGYGREHNYSGDPNNQDDRDKRIEELRRVVTQGANEAQVRVKRIVDKANDYFQQAQATPTPQQARSAEEQRIRQLANVWSNENWRVARELGTYMEVVSWTTNEVWEVTLQTRWETRSLEVVTEPYTGQTMGAPRPILPVWDYELPTVVGLRAPQTRTPLEGQDDIISCTTCNGTGHMLCSSCTGRGWIVCPDCKGRAKKRCATCRGRGYVSDVRTEPRKPFIQKQAENVVNSVGGRVSEVFDTIRQQGVPIPNPLDSDPAGKGPTIPCPDCINGEVACTCGNGKRVCSTCQGARMSLCTSCSGTGRLVRHRDILRSFDLRTQTRYVGNSPIPQQYLARANGDLVYSAEVDETLHAEAAPDGVPMDVWRVTVALVQEERRGTEKPGFDAQPSSRPTLQVIELVRIPYTEIRYRFADQDYTFYAYDGEGREKFYAERYPARWDRIERLVKAISTDLMAPIQRETPDETNTQEYGRYSPSTESYRVPIEVPPYTISEDEEDDPTEKR